MSFDLSGFDTMVVLWAAANLFPAPSGATAGTAGHSPTTRPPAARSSPASCEAGFPSRGERLAW